MDVEDQQKLVRDPSIEEFIRKSYEREDHRDRVSQIRYSLHPSEVTEYDIEVNKEITSFEKKRLLLFVIVMILITPVIIYGMYDFATEDSCEDSNDCSISDVWLNVGILAVSFISIGIIAGIIAVKTNINVGYTRKALHFSSFFLPFAVNEIVSVPSHFSITLLKFWLILIVYVLATKPIRRKFYLAGLLFRAIDRPDDRPHTLFWMVSQFLSSSIIILLASIVFISWEDDETNYPEDFTDQLMLILVFINGLGDGLAEPVGVKFGKYQPCGISLKYKTRGYWLETENNERKCPNILFKYDYFTRSYPGSFMVWLVSLVSILALNEPFIDDQLWIGAVFIPPLMTLTEAYSPRTWDSPFLFLIGAIALGLLVKIPILFLILMIAITMSFTIIQLVKKFKSDNH